MRLDYIEHEEQIVIKVTLSTDETDFIDRNGFGNIVIMTNPIGEPILLSELRSPGGVRLTGLCTCKQKDLLQQSRNSLLELANEIAIRRRREVNGYNQESASTFRERCHRK